MFLSEPIRNAARCPGKEIPMTDVDRLKAKFWTALADSPLLFLQLDGDPRSAVPMTAQLDRDADSAI